VAVKQQSNVRTRTGTLFGRAAIYARISLDKVREATGVRRQIDACRQLADLEGWSVDEVLIDHDLSAYSGACRPEYERLLDLVHRREIDVIVAYHHDRLYRRLADLVELTKVVAAGHVDLNTASGRFTAQVLGAAAEHESARTGERVSAKHHQSAATPTAAAAPPATGEWPRARSRSYPRRLTCSFRPPHACWLASRLRRSSSTSTSAASPRPTARSGGPARSAWS
jgi:hypothetical protein